MHIDLCRPILWVQKKVSLIIFCDHSSQGSYTDNTLIKLSKMYLDFKALL